MFEWIADPTIWAGLMALILLEIVLGIDNLVFIAVLAEKLPPSQRDKARVLGLSLALLMRLGLLFSIAWLVTLTQPLFTVAGHPVSGRDLILLAGGLFLLYKATTELHGRLEGRPEHMNTSVVYASFSVVVTQIVVLDAVFSIDSVITAIGMTDELGVMMIAMIVAMVIMLISSKWLTRFVSEHPTLIILCLSFLLMIGFSLVAEGLGFHIPKGYLYAAIGFSLMIEIFNQLAQFNKEKWLRRGSIRDRAVENIFRMLGGSSTPQDASGAVEIVDPEQDPTHEVFQANERDMIRGVLALADTNIKALMTPRREVHMLDLSSTLEQQREQLLNTSYSRLVVIRDGKQDEPLGLIQKKTLLDALLRGETLNIERHIEQPVVLLETQDAIQTLEIFRREGRQMAFVVDEFGTLEGIVSLTDIMEAIAGDMLDVEEPHEPYVVQTDDGVYLVDAGESINDINRHLPLPLPRGQDYSTLAGLILNRLEHMPVENEELDVDGWNLRVVEMDVTRIAKVELRRLDATPDNAAQQELDY